MTHARPTSEAAQKHAADPYKWGAWAVAIVVILTPPALLGTVRSALPRPEVSEFEVAAERLGVHPGAIELGRGTFLDSCSVCHGHDARGIARLGKPLRNSEFVQSHSDDEIYQVILTGRPPTDPENTTGSAMPARAGNPSLDDRRLHNVVLYLRTLQEPGAPLASLDDWVVAETADAGGAGGGIGHAEFVASCSACHGASGEGIEGLGKPLANSPFVDSKSDDELMVFVKSGRPIWDAQNTTGIDMPPKGGNPALSDEELRKIVGYIRELHAGG